jgi:hypothetical protein
MSHLASQLTSSWCGRAASAAPNQPLVLARRTARRWAAPMPLSYARHDVPVTVAKVRLTKTPQELQVLGDLS